MANRIERGSGVGILPVIDMDRRTLAMSGELDTIGIIGLITGTGTTVNIGTITSGRTGVTSVIGNIMTVTTAAGITTTAITTATETTQTAHCGEEEITKTAITTVPTTAAAAMVTRVAVEAAIVPTLDTGTNTSTSTNKDTGVDMIVAGRCRHRVGLFPRLHLRPSFF